MSAVSKSAVSTNPPAAAILGVAADVWRQAGGATTAHEIAQQPAIWPAIAALVAQRRGALDAFLAPLLANPALRIVLTGAGTSAFIGECLAPALLGAGLRAEAIPTTDLVSGPGLFLQPQVPTLVVSFARSGGSPESVAAVVLADQLVGEVHHLVITCNADGQLHRMAQERANAHILLLPDSTHDRGFAMTTSFTSMLLAAALAFEVVAPAEVEAAAAATAGMLTAQLPRLQGLVERRFERVVYLGSNALRGLAREAALKLLELTDGATVAIHDSPLGFRHGPKTIVDGATLVVVMLANDAQARRYDLDLLRELTGDGRAGAVLALGGAPDAGASAKGQVVVAGAAGLSELALALPFIVFCQAFALLQSLQLGLRPDTPSVSGTVNRVVRGVTIYPFEQGGGDVPRR